MALEHQDSVQGSETRDGTVNLGPVYFVPLQNGLRSIRCNGVEAVRSLEFLVRDSSWATAPLRAIPHASSTRGDFHAFGFDFSALDGAIEGKVSFEVGTGGLTARLDGCALRDVELNRIGFVLLSPLVGLSLIHI